MSENENAALASAMAALSKLYAKQDTTKLKLANTPKTPVKKLKKRRNSKVPLAPIALKESFVVAEFTYSWRTCACGLNHPPVPAFKPPDGKKCTFYWQVADLFPYMTLHRALSTEIKFMEADIDQSGLIELGELKLLLKSILGEDVSNKVVEKTFQEVDEDKSGTLDFAEVLNVIDALVQRRENQLPGDVQKEYSKACTIQ